MGIEFSRKRRIMLKTSAVGLGAVVSGFVPWVQLQAADLPHVDEDDDTAKALQYVHDATRSDKRADANAFCHNCRYFKGDKGSEWDRCDLFPGKAVNAQGWCNVWAAK